jgi:hypothetical protein
MARSARYSKWLGIGGGPGNVTSGLAMALTEFSGPATAMPLLCPIRRCAGR